MWKISQKNFSTQLEQSRYKIQKNIKLWALEVRYIKLRVLYSIIRRKYIFEFHLMIVILMY